MQARKLITVLLLSLLIGILFAGLGTKLHYPCPPGPGEAGCVSIEKGIMHPGDVIANKQGSLNRFFGNFTGGFLVTFLLLGFLVVSRSRQQLMGERNAD